MATRRALRREVKRLKDDLRRMTEDRNAQRSLAATHLSNLTRVASKYSEVQDQLAGRTEERNQARSNLRTTEDQLGQARRETALRIGKQVEYSDRAVANMRRLARAVRACARYRAELATQGVVTKRLTEQLFDAIGYQPGERILLARTNTTPPPVKEISA
jgi:chromosome segregation ATPase